MNWLFTTLICILLAEFIYHIPLKRIFSHINLVSRKSLHTLRSGTISDHWKEKAILAYSYLLFLETVKLVFSFLAVGLLVVILVFIFEYFNTEIGSFIVSVTGSLYSIIIASVYLLIRKFLV